MPVSLAGIKSKSNSIPTPPLSAISEVEQVNPAAPISCAATTAPVLKASKQASTKDFSKKGSPTCTQNPLLLLAKATFYPHKSPQYQTYYDQGFELARRLQDAEALQAYREEDWYQAQQLTGQIIGLDDPSQLDMIDVMQRMAREAFGMDVPPEVIAQMLPELEAQVGYDDDDDDELDPFFSPLPPGRGKKSSKKRKKSFFDL